MGTKEVEIKNIGLVTLRELNNDDRELIQNESTEVVGIGRNRNTNVKLGTLNKYTFILGIAKAPFFKTDINDGCTLETMKERLIEYKKLDYRIVETLIPHIAEFNNINEEEFDDLKKN